MWHPLGVVGILVKAMSKVWRFTALILPEVKVGREILAHAWATYKSWRKRLQLFIQSNMCILQATKNETVRRPRKEWAYSPCTASPAGLFIAIRSSVQQSMQVCCQFVPQVFENGFICSLTILVQHHATFCCQRCFPAWLRGCTPERYIPMQSMVTVEDRSESQLEHLTNVAESGFHQTDRNWLHKITAHW